MAMARTIYTILWGALMLVVVLIPVVILFLEGRMLD